MDIIKEAVGMKVQRIVKQRPFSEKQRLYPPISQHAQKSQIGHR